jgi:hypothetical protein
VARLHTEMMPLVSAMRLLRSSQAEKLDMDANKESGMRTLRHCHGLGEPGIPAIKVKLVLLLLVDRRIHERLLLPDVGVHRRSA